MDKLAPPWLKPLLYRFFSHTSDAIDFMQRLLQIDDIVRLPVLKRSYLVNHPDAIHHILLGNQKNYTKEGTGYSRLGSLVGPGLLTTSGEDWEERRHRYQPKFHGKRLQQYEHLIQTCTQKMLQRWENRIGEQINVSDEMLSLVMNITTQAFLGIDISERTLELVKRVHFLNQFAIRKITPFKWIPTLNNLRFQIYSKRFDGFLLDSLHHSSSKITDPLLADILVKDDQGNFKYSDNYILGEAKNFFVAGHETTGNSVAWTMFSLVKHPYIMQQVLKEIAEVIGNEMPNFESIEHLPYLEMVIQESLRLYPPIWFFTRQAIEEDQLLNYRIPAHSLVNIIIHQVHRHPRYWHQPNVFYPERFKPEANKNRPKCAFMPFGFGPRVCIGRQFAMMNMKMILVMALQKYLFELPKSNYEPKVLPLITLNAKDGIRLRLKR